MAFSGNFHDNKAAIISFLTAHNQMRPRPDPGIADLAIVTFHDETDLYKTLFSHVERTVITNEPTESQLLRESALRIFNLIHPCFSGNDRDPFPPEQAELDNTPEPVLLDASHIENWVPARRAGTPPDSVSADGETNAQVEDPWIKTVKTGRAFILHYLHRLSKSGFHPDFGPYEPYDPRIAKWIAQEDALSIAFIKARETNFITEGQLALRAASRREWKNFMGITGVSLAVPVIGFGVGAVIGFSVIKLGVAAIAIAAFSFPPILLVGAVVAVVATIAYCCIRKYKKSPMFTKKHPPKIPPRSALLFSTPNPHNLGHRRYEAFRALFEDLHQKLVEPLKPDADESLKRVRAFQDQESERSTSSFLKKRLQKWKAADMAQGADRPKVLLENFEQIMVYLEILKTDPDYKVIRPEINKTLCALCTKDMWDFYFTFSKHSDSGAQRWGKRALWVEALNKHADTALAAG